MVLAGEEGGVVIIQTSGDIWVGKFISDAFHICKEHCEVMSVVLLAYRAVAQMVGLIKFGKMLLHYKIDHLLLGRFKTGWWKVPRPWLHPW